MVEEVLGATSGECLKMTEEIEEKLGKVQTRSFKPEYYQKAEENVTLHMHQNEN